jgi:regulator of cell morphogenesis and NO signaling
MAFSEFASVAEIVTASPAAARVLEQPGIDPSREGRKRFADVCREKGLDASVVSAGMESSQTDWTAVPLSRLIAHIIEDHHEFLRRELPVLAEQLGRVARVYAEREPEAMAELPAVFAALMDELSLHMRKEEIVLFPAIEGYEAATGRGEPLPPAPCGSVAHPIGMMRMEHQDATGALSRIRELTKAYAVPAYACPTYTALMNGLRILEADLHQHIHLEDDILFPRALRLEQRMTSGY